ncbi:hypothetical protein LMG31884_47410 (plasmid) [Xanthomonas hydrangeae]|uniref:type IV pilus biogenesis protein PilP n=1 Tax=Xanthomonas hydrangeae TaxID=2775159 RepID=UPI0019644108|nr:hypothetical protein LMG31884_47410 [Xanthomonas hydrangeae]CAD7741206.1 hypothetical protein LMG31884_47410 [Xanthomonas hydrangeae]CAD7747938.1 hypothetical protein LMG31887_46400 [Xanthomonas hydrangeae]CAD7747939.1 hypothetical protein LMG31887_46400 [Xanthomonas hydrangeae]CAD7748184.1 hypothetical protein LMG31885_45090 [Xanthomonas hydrangeae]
MAAKPLTLALFIVATFAVTSDARALSGGDSDTPITAGDLAELQSRIVYARAQAELAELQRKSVSVSGTGEADISQQAAGNALPVVTGVYGRDRDLYASFLYSTGMDWQAKAGMTAPGGYLVKSITQDRVVLTKDARSYVLGFSSIAPAEPSSSTEQTKPVGTMNSPFLPLPAGK